MDAVAGLLDGPRARGAFTLRVSMDPPWCLRIEDEAPLTVVAVLRGEVWLIGEDAEPVTLGPGEVAVVRGPEPYLVAEGPETAPTVLVKPGGDCVSLAGESLAKRMRLGVRSWGNAAAGEAVMLIGTYYNDGDVSRRLLRALPAVLSLRAGEWDSPLVGLLDEELAKDEPGQEAVLDRLLDLLLVAVLRAWFARPDDAAPDWYRAYGDPVVGRALRLLQDNPAHPWTVAALAAEVGLSRAALARRFTELVGEPPIGFLAAWRINLAADLLLEPGATLESVAAEVGYANPFALSAAFKRLRGVTPRQHRGLAGKSAVPITVV